MNYEQSLQYIHSLSRFGSQPGLSRVLSLLSKLGNPQNGIKAVHIAGTNGKGSTATMISEGLISSGKKVGLYISPFIIDFRERIQINHEYISKEDLARLTTLVSPVAESMQDHPTEFEIITAIMFLYFKEQNIDIAVIEVGMGGRLDATNVIVPLISVITKISLDHTAVLGDTVSKIAFEKAGIIKNGVPVVLAPKNLPETVTVIENVAKEKNAPLYIPETDNNISLSLSGEYQKENAASAVAALKLLGVAEKDILNGIQKAFIPARLEKIANGVFIDGAHNPDGITALCNSMEGKPFIVIGMMKDKDVSFAVKMLEQKISGAVAVTVESNPRTMKADELKDLFSIKNVFTAQNYTEALVLADKLRDKNPLYICGSLYLASDIRPLAIKRYNTTTK